MPIDLGLEYDAAEKESKMEPVIPGTYEFMVDRIDEGNTKDGRPQWTWWLKIVNNPTYPNRVLPYNTVFPWIDPATGQRDTKGIGLLVAVGDGIGSKWVGTILPDKETFYGKGGFVRVGLRQYVDAMGEKQTGNQLRIVTSKRKK
ncbi:MAG: DUF669 domain-containing protein [Candidatus Methanoperedens sp.]|nr:DUF669 domain-containing protein [Candidatus Methanoperedens sp.]